MTKRQTEYLIYRHGSNGANQSLCNKAPVAIIVARSRREALEKVATERPDITVYNNQFLTATPQSHANADDWNSQIESIT